MKTGLFAGIVFIFFIVAAAVLAAPNKPDQFTSGTPQGRTVDNQEKTVSAFAGNVTQINIYNTMITRRWQGYYGNVSGKITLDDASNWTMYDWGLGAVEGEIYASNSSNIGWDTIRCINLSASYKGQNCTGQNESCLNITKIETAYGMGASDNDGVDETFNATLGNIMVGTTTLSNCQMVNLYANDTSQSTYFWNETMLTYNNTETIIYAGIVNDNTWGFNNATWDFQMIVGDNGDDSVATTYYFYVELA